MKLLFRSILILSLVLPLLALPVQAQSELTISVVNTQQNAIAFSWTQLTDSSIRYIVAVYEVGNWSGYFIVRSQSTNRIRPSGLKADTEYAIDVTTYDRNFNYLGSGSLMARTAP